MKNKKCVLISVGLKGSRRGKRRQKAANSEMSSERYNIASGFVRTIFRQKLKKCHFTKFAQILHHLKEFYFGGKFYIRKMPFEMEVPVSLTFSKGILRKIQN
jgi:hypothetical protein